MKKVTKLGLEVLTGKALSFWLEFIDKTGEKGFCLQMQIKLKSCVTLLSWKEEFTTPFEESSQQELNKCLQDFICRQEKATTAAVRSLCTKIVIVGDSKWV